MLYHRKQPFYMLGNSFHISQCLLIMIHSSRLTGLYLIVNVGGSNPWCLSNISQYLQINGLVRIYIQQLINLNQHIGTGEILKKTFMNNALEIQMANNRLQVSGIHNTAFQIWCTNSSFVFFPNNTGNLENSLRGFNGDIIAHVESL